MKTPRCIVEVRWGKLAGTKAILAPGEVLRVGRTSFAQLIVPHDESLAGVHFELSWDGEACRLLDRSGERGTLLGGQMEYGITSADGLRRFVMLRVALGPGVFAMPLFDEYMRRGHYTAEERFSAFLDVFIDEAERHARGGGLSWQVE